MPSLRDIILANQSAYGPFWVGDYRISFNRGGYETVRILDGRDAGLRKSECSEIVFEAINFNDSCCLLNSDWFDMELEEAFSLAMEADWIKNKWGGFESIEADGIRIHRDSRNALRVFNPNHLDRFKPLKELPKKWSIAHAVRALVNGQASAYRDYRYTDDYAYDAAYDYAKGEVDALKFAKDLIEEPSGWRAYSNSNGYVNVCCHSFESITLTLKNIVGLESQVA